MAAGNNRDVTMTIRARDNASASLQTIDDALKRVSMSQGGTAASASDLSAALSTVDKSAGAINAAADRAAAGLAKMQSRIAGSRDELDRLQREASDASRALATLQSPDAIVSAGRDQSGRLAQVAELQRQYERLQREIGKVTATIATGEAQINSRRSAIQELGSTAIAAADAQATLRAQIDAVTDAEERRAAAAERLQRAEEFQRQRQAFFAPRRAAIENGAGFEALAAEDQRLERAAAALRASLNPVVAIQESFNAKLREANELFRAGKISAAELTKQTGLLQVQMKRATDGASSGGKFAAFGLRPHELTNLGYQVNDVATQLASGTSLAQTLGQQAGQIIQIFPRVGSAIAGAFTSPAFLGAAAVVGGIAVAVARLNAEAERKRDFTGLLTANGNGLQYQVAELEKVTVAARQIGIAADDATAALRTFVAAGISPAGLDDFLRTSRDLATSMGTKLPDAAKLLADGFDGGFESIKRLDDATKTFTAAELERIQALYAEGKAQEARSEAFRIFSDRLANAAAQMRSPWSEAATKFGASWDGALSAFANTAPLKAINALLLDAAAGVTRLLNLLGGSKSQFDLFAEMSRLSIRIREAEGNQARDPSIARAEGIRRLREQLTALRAEYDASGGIGRSAASSDTLAGGDTPARKREQVALRELSLQQQLEAARNRLDVREAARLAGLIAAQGVEGDILKTKTAQVAAERERVSLQQRVTAAAKAAASERERQISQFEGRVVGAEGGAGKNPFSSAKGFGQFTEGTFLDQFAKVFGDESKRLSRDQILALRNNATIAKAVIDNYARENARFLESFGAKVTAGNLYLAHFLGAAGAKKVLTADGATPVDNLVSKEAFNANKGYLTTNGRPRTAAELKTFIAGRVGDTGQAQSAGAVEVEKVLERSRQKQEEFTAATARENDDRQRNIDALRIENGLIDTALIAAQREAEITKTVTDLQARAADANRNLQPGESPVTVTPEEIERTRALAAAEFDLQNARRLAQAQQNEVERPVSDLENLQQALGERAAMLRDLGDGVGAKEVGRQLDQVNGKLRQAIVNAIEFYKALKPNDNPLGLTKEQIEAIIIKLQIARDTSKEWGTVLMISARDIAEAFASTVTAAVDKFAKSLAEGKNVFKSLKSAFLDFASSFLRQIAQMITQLIAFNIAKRLLSSAGVPVGTNHTGGIAGMNRTETRTVSPAWFAGAIRMHTGGIAGLKPNEVPTILEKGEEVLTRSNPRHRDNAGRGGSSGGGGSLKVVNVFDAGAAVEEALNTPAGEKAILNHVRNNPQAWKAALGT